MPMAILGSTYMFKIKNSFMKQLNEHHSFTGMQRDMSIAKHPSSFLYDAHNIRLTARGEDTLLTITNERGTSYAGVEIKGTYLGHCLLGKYLTVFSTGGLEEDDDTLRDYITRIDLSTKESVVLYKGNLEFDIEHPIETVGSYENNDIQKVYWTDGKNQPRLINIVDIDNIRPTDCDTQFDFIRELSLQEDVTIQKQLGSSGSFAPGVIQYAFTYYNKHGQETNIFYTSPLLYISHKDRGASPEDKVENAFKITLKNIDKSFDYVRIYSIQRTSIDAVPIVRRVQDINTKLDSVSIRSERWLSTKSIKIYNDNIELQPSWIYGKDYSVLSGENSPLIFNNIQTPSGSFTEDLYWYGFTKSDYPKLKIQTEDGIVTWDEDSTNDSTLWVSSIFCKTNGVVPEDTLGYHIVQTTDTNYTQSVGVKVQVNPLDIITFLDTGISGDAIDPTELLYKGGESIVAQTIEQKDGTLFLGNLELKRLYTKDIKNIKNAVKSLTSISQSTRTFTSPLVSSSPYYYFNQLTAYDGDKSVPCGGFKKGDFYRCGVQFQYKDGRWSDPIFIDDVQVTNGPSVNNNVVTVPALNGTINASIVHSLIELGYKKARALIVFPEPQDRVTICQGITCPTLFTNNNRGANGEGILYGQSSWFFRPKLLMDSNIHFINNRKVVSPKYPIPASGESGAYYTDTTVGDTSLLRTGDTTSDFLYYMDRGEAGYVPLDLHLNVWETIIGTDSNPWSFRAVEIQGHFSNDNKYRIDTNLLTFHSPDLDFDSTFPLTNFADTSYRVIGAASFDKTLSDISIQTETPTIASGSYGFIHKSFTENYSHGIVSGIFYEDFMVEDIVDGEKFQAWENQKSPFEWVVSPWQCNGSLNNDITRPADKGNPTSTLKKKVISNLRYASTYFNQVGNLTDFSIDPQLFDSDQVTVIKVNNHIYQGNIDTSLYPDKADGSYFMFNANDGDDEEVTSEDVTTDFDSDIKGTYQEGGRTYTYSRFRKLYSLSEETDKQAGIWRFLEYRKWYPEKNTSNYQTKYVWYREDNDDFGNTYIQLLINKAPIRIKYKSSPHLVLDTESGISWSTSIGEDNDIVSSLPIVEIVRKGDTYRTSGSFYRATMFGGTSEDALKANKWIPCGEPVSLVDGNDCTYSYSYGDTYFQRWDCLKTYPFSNDDINQVVEIGSFMLETRVNIDGRYDRNRGQVSNLNMSPINFNLFNPVYNQTDNFFSYRILDDSYYKINKFPNQITWTKEKKAGADIDLWTNITLASTYDMDGSKGEVKAIRTWQDNIYCFQDLGISNILFNSRVQIPTSDGVPIEISNSYKVDGYRYISDGIGCTNKWTISNTPSGLYFADTKTNHLHHIGSQGIQDVTTIHNMTSWFNNVGSNRITKTLHDDVNHDLYALTPNEAICYSEVLGNFTSFMSYQGISLIESYENSVYTMKDGKLYSMFTGKYNKFFGENYEPWDFTFISNGIDNNLMDFDKVYSTIDYRMDMMSDTGYQHDNSLDFIRVYNEYQDTEDVNLNRSNTSLSFWNKEANLQKKFRIWRIQIPRDKKGGNGLDRIRNTWCKIKLGSKSENNYKAVLHDLNVQYYL